MAVLTLYSGGQSGVDRAALDFAIASGIQHGGWCPPGRPAEDGVIDAKYHLQEVPEGGYRQRTKRNVLDSDATLIVNTGDMEGGTMATLRFAEKFKKPVCVVQLDDGITPEVVQKVTQWINDLKPTTLNLAGPRESKRPGIYQLTYELLSSVGFSK